MVKYQCFRCGYECNQKGMLLNHLSRKNQCQSILKEINNIDILKLNKIEEYNKTNYNIPLISPIYPPNITPSQIKPKQNNICNFCNKELSNYKKKWKHEKICKIKNEKFKLFEKQQDKINELEKKVNELSLKYESSKNINILGNNYSNNTIINNIQINNFESENVKYFNENMILKLMNGFKAGQFLELLHFNKNHPENHTIRIKDSKSGLGEIVEDGKWKYTEMDIFLNIVLRNIRDKFMELEDKISEEKKEQYEKLIDNIENILDNEKKVKSIKKH